MVQLWFNAPSGAKFGWLGPRTGKSDLIALGSGAAPPRGQNAIARVDPATDAVKLCPLTKVDHDPRRPTFRQCGGAAHIGQPDRRMNSS